jgi:aspartyl-tRNA(Asn)/glutamyl-tRNA(Gln) amidotransferase subunit C
MAISVDETRKAARLARLALRDADLAALSSELSAILDSFAALTRVDTAGAAPMHHPVEVETPFRRDVPGDMLGADEALGGAPARAEGLFVVPPIIDDPEKTP